MAEIQTERPIIIQTETLPKLRYPRLIQGTKSYNIGAVTNLAILKLKIAILLNSSTVVIKLITVDLAVKLIPDLRSLIKTTNPPKEKYLVLKNIILKQG